MDLPLAFTLVFSYWLIQYSVCRIVWVRWQGILVPGERSVDLEVGAMALLLFCLWNVTWFYLSITIGTGFFAIAVIRLILDLVLFLGIFYARFVLWKPYFDAREGAPNPWFVLFVLVSAIFGVLAFMKRPMGSDNVALYWLAYTLAQEKVHLAAAQGSPFYISILWFPGALFRDDLFVGNLAGLLKVFSVMGVVMALWWTFQRHFSQRGIWLSGLAFFLFLSTFLFDYGIFVSGKESPQGMTFVFILCGLLATRTPVSRGGIHSEWTIGVLCGLAVGFAAVTLPYLLVILGLAYLFRLVSKEELGRLFVVGLAAVPFSIASMLGQGILVSTLIYLATGAIGWGVVIGIERWRGRYGSRSRFHSWVAGLLILAPVVVLVVLLPIRYAPLPFAPLDGATGFFDLFRANRLNTLAEIAAYAGFLLMSFHAVRSGRLGYAIFLSVPWWCLVIVISICHAPPSWLPFHPQHLWDLAKNVPNWWLGFYFVFCCGYAVNALFRSAEDRGLIQRIPYRRFIFGILMAAVILYDSNRMLHQQFREAPEVHRDGAALSHDPEFSRVMNAAASIAREYRGRGDARRKLYIIGDGEEIWSRPDRVSAFELHNAGWDVVETGAPGEEELGEKLRKAQAGGLALFLVGPEAGAALPTDVIDTTRVVLTLESGATLRQTDPAG